MSTVTINPSRERIDQAKASFLQAKQRLDHALATTPDDRINWSPSATSRTPLALVAHAAGAIKNIHETLDGRTFFANSTSEADIGFREWERQFTTREQVLDLIEQNSSDYVAWLDDLAPERLETLVEMPFGLGQVPLGVALTFPPAHTVDHASQIVYIQTIYGDHDWHL